MKIHDTPVFDGLPGVIIAKGPPTFSKNKIKNDEDFENFLTHEGFNRRGSMAPARLKPDAYDIQHKKLAKPVPQLPSEAYEALRLTKEYLERYIDHCEFLSDEQVMHGVKDEHGDLNPLELSTSAGYMFSSRGKKKVWVEEHLGDWEKYIKEDWESLCNPTEEIVQWIWRLSQKQEKRDVVRVAERKTRMFCASPFPILYHGRKLFGDFTRKFYHAQSKTDFVSAVGVNVFGGHWHKMVQWMTDNFRQLDGSEGDISGMDKYMSSEILMLIGNMLTEFYPKETRYIQQRHWHRYVVKIVADIYGNIRLLLQGNPSGGPETVVINTIVTIWMGILVRVLKLKRGGVERVDLDMILPTMRDKYYGDDVFSFNRYFRFEDYSEAANMLGFDYTGKNGNMFTLSFLGRRNILVGGYVLPSLSADRILSIMEWKENDDIVASYQRIFSAHIAAFPLLFSDALSDREVYWVARCYVRDLRERLFVEADEESRKQLVLPWSESKMAAFYTGMERALSSKIDRNLRQLNRKEICTRQGFRESEEARSLASGAQA